jgi:hypothetical protein
VILNLLILELNVVDIDDDDDDDDELFVELLHAK